MTESSDNLRMFEAIVSAAPLDENAERIVRAMIAKNAVSCPMEVLMQLAKCVIDCRRSELMSDAQLN